MWIYKYIQELYLNWRPLVWSIFLYCQTVTTSWCLLPSEAQDLETSFVTGTRLRRSEIGNLLIHNMIRSMSACRLIRLSTIEFPQFFTLWLVMRNKYKMLHETWHCFGYQRCNIGTSGSSTWSRWAWGWRTPSSPSCVSPQQCPRVGRTQGHLVITGSDLDWTLLLSD